MKKYFDGPIMHSEIGAEAVQEMVASIGELITNLDPTSSRTIEEILKEFAEGWLQIIWHAQVRYHAAMEKTEEQIASSQNLTLRDQWALRAPPVPEWFRPMLQRGTNPDGTEQPPPEDWEVRQAAEAQWPYHYAGMVLKARGR
jgi:hypothetical protein